MDSSIDRKEHSQRQHFSADELRALGKHPSPSSQFSAKRHFLTLIASALTQKNSHASLQVARSTSFVKSLAKSLHKPKLDSLSSSQSPSSQVVSPKSLRHEILVDSLIKQIYPNQQFSLPPLRKVVQPKHAVVSSEIGNKNSMISLQSFREMLLARFGSVEEAFHKIDTNMDRALNVREWLTILVKLQICSPQDARKIFDITDIDRSGSVTGKEFVRVVEGAAPIRDLEDFRRRLLLAHKSTRAGFKLFGRAASGEGAGDVQLDLAKFTVLVAIPVGIIKQNEATLLHKLMDLNGDNFTTLNECTRALLPLSPHLLVEDMLGILSARFNSIKKALSVIFDPPVANYPDFSIEDADLKHPLQIRRSTSNLEELAISREQFIENLISKVPNPQGINQQDAGLFFDAIDLNGEGQVTKSQIESALRLSENTKALNSLRKTVLGFFGSLKQAFARIDQTLAEAVEDSNAGNCTTLLLSEFEEILAPLGVKSADIAKLYRLFDVDNDEQMTLTEFLNGVRLFAPWAIVNPLKASIPNIFNTNAAAQSVGSSSLHRSVELLLDHLKSLSTYRDPIKFEEFIDLMQSSRITEIATRPDLVTLYFLLDAQAEGKIVGLDIKLRELLTGALDSTSATQTLFGDGAREFVAESTQKARKWAADLRINARQVADLPTPRPWRKIRKSGDEVKQVIQAMPPSLKNIKLIAEDDPLTVLVTERQRIRPPLLSKLLT